MTSYRFTSAALTEFLGCDVGSTQSLLLLYDAWNLNGDPKKAAINVAKHGVSFQEATTVFDDVLSVTVPDPDHTRWKRIALLSSVCHIEGGC